MNNPSEKVPNHRQDADATNRTRPLYWSVWRELWENRSIYIAPLAVAGVVLLGFMISTYGMPERRRGVLLMDPAKQRALISEPYDAAAMMLIFTVFIVGVFYCLDALYGERRDRSILFWKSLPRNSRCCCGAAWSCSRAVWPARPGHDLTCSSNR